MTKYYVISSDDIPAFHGDLTDEQFISFATENGQVFDNPQDFAKAFNDQDINTYTDVIRIIEHPNEIVYRMTNANVPIDRTKERVMPPEAKQ